MLKRLKTVTLSNITQPFKNVINLTKKHENRKKTQDNDKKATELVNKIINLGLVEELSKLYDEKMNHSDNRKHSSYIAAFDKFKNDLNTNLKTLITISKFDMSTGTKEKLRNYVVNYIKKILETSYVVSNEGPITDKLGIDKEKLKTVYTAWHLKKYGFFTRKKNTRKSANTKKISNNFIKLHNNAIPKNKKKNNIQQERNTYNVNLYIPVAIKIYNILSPDNYEYFLSLIKVLHKIFKKNDNLINTYELTESKYSNVFNIIIYFIKHNNLPKTFQEYIEHPPEDYRNQPEEDPPLLPDNNIYI